MRAARETLGPGRDLMIDGGQAYTVKRARAAPARASRSIGLYWFEEPFAPDDLRRLPAAVRRRHRANRRRGSRLDDRRPSARSSNAVTSTCSSPTSRAAAVSRSPDRSPTARARTSAVEIVPHCFSTGVLVAASLHFVATLDRDQRSPSTRSPTRRSSTGCSLSPFVLRDGRLAVPTGPGLGIELDETRLERLRPWTTMAAIEFRPGDEALPGRHGRGRRSRLSRSTTASS